MPFSRLRPRQKMNACSDCRSISMRSRVAARLLHAARESNENPSEAHEQNRASGLGRWLRCLAPRMTTAEVNTNLHFGIRQTNQAFVCVLLAAVSDVPNRAAT